MSEPSQGRSLPWFRVDVDLVDHPKVSQLGIELGVAECAAGWFIIRLWSWTMRYAARGRLAPGAETALERACGWRGEPGRLVSGLVATGWLEDDGNNGLEVHDWAEHNGAAVAKAEKDAERKRGARAARAGRSTGAEKAADRPARAAGNGTERNGTGRNVEEEAAPPPDAQERTPVVFVEPTTDPDTWLAEDFFAWAQSRRQKAGLVGERRRPRNLAGWWSTCLMTPGVTAERMQGAFLAFGDSKHWQAAQPPLPFQGFMAQWDQFVPREVSRAS